MLTALKTLSVLTPGVAFTDALREKLTETAKLAEANNKATIHLQESEPMPLIEIEPMPAIAIEQTLDQIAIDEPRPLIMPPICDPFFEDCGPGNPNPNKQRYSKSSVHSITWNALVNVAVPALMYYEIS